MDGHQIPFDQLFVALAQEQSHLLLDNGIWFSLDRPEFAELAQLIAESRELLDAPPGDGAAQPVPRRAVGGRSRTSASSPARWTPGGNGSQPCSDDHELSDLKPPAGLEATLRPYQEDGFRRLATMFAHGLGGILADDMGLGKTVQTLALILHAREHAARGAAGRPFLVVAPTSVVANWAQRGRPVRPGPVRRHDQPDHGPARAGSRRRCAPGPTWWSPRTRCSGWSIEQYRDVDVGGARPGRGADRQEPPQCRLPVRPRAAGAVQARHHRHPDGEQPDGAVVAAVDHRARAVPAPRPVHRATTAPRSSANRDADRLAQLRRRIRPLMLRRTQGAGGRRPARQAGAGPRAGAAARGTAPSTRQYLQRERQKVLGLLGDLNRNRFEILRSLTLLRQASLDPALVDPAARRACRRPSSTP